ncbi:hypothetical protein SLA2020_427440 [Shorea laevis]
MGNEGGRIDLNFGTADLVLLATRSDNDNPPVRLLPPPLVVRRTSSAVARRSVKETLKQFYWCELTDVSRLLQEEAMGSVALGLGRKPELRL